MDDILRFPSAITRDPAIDAWLAAQRDDLRTLAETWFACMRQQGGDVRELMHDGCPTACVGDAAFAYVGAFRDHVNVGFFFGALLVDPTGMLEGTGKRGRHKGCPARRRHANPCFDTLRCRKLLSDSDGK